MEQTVPANLVEGAGGPVLELIPDPSFWTDPGVSFPVTIDPLVSLSLLLDTFVSEDNQNTSYGSNTTLRTGRLATGGRYRSFVGFDRAAIAGKDVQSATLTLHETQAVSCTASQVDLTSVTSTPTPPYTWLHQPALGTVYASATQAYGGPTYPGAGDVVFSGDGMKTLVQASAWSR